MPYKFRIRLNSYQTFQRVRAHIQTWIRSDTPCAASKCLENTAAERVLFQFLSLNIEKQVRFELNTLNHTLKHLH